MKILCDEGLPKPFVARLRQELPEHTFVRAQEMGWIGENEPLSAIASKEKRDLGLCELGAKEGFGLFIVGEKSKTDAQGNRYTNFERQQNLDKLPIAVVCLDTSDRHMMTENMLDLIPKLRGYLDIVEQDVRQLQKYELQYER